MQAVLRLIGVLLRASWRDLEDLPYLYSLYFDLFTLLDTLLISL
jgi:hypothetical protein